jgi:hypothetical protein
MIREKVDPTTGQLATWRCPEKIEELFIEGTEPTTRCETHGHWRWWWSSEPEEPDDGE